MASTFICGTGFEMDISPHRDNSTFVITGSLGVCGNNSNGKAPRSGSYQIQNSSGTGTLTININSATGLNLTLSDIYINFAYRRDTSGDTLPTIRIYLTDANYLALVCDGSYWDAYVGASKVADGSVYMNIYEYVHVQWHVNIADSGTIETIINGYPDISYSGDTKPGASTTINYFYISSTRASYSYPTFDDIALGTGGWLGDVRFEKLQVDADTVDSDWTPSTGISNFEMINEIPPVDTDYIYSSTNAQQNISTLTDWDDTDKTPIGIMHWVGALKDTVNDQRVKLLSRLGTTVVTTSGYPLTTSKQMYCQPMGHDPDGSDWTNTSIDSLEVGVEAVVP